VEWVRALYALLEAAGAFNTNMFMSYANNVTLGGIDYTTDYGKLDAAKKIAYQYAYMLVTIKHLGDFS